jgi:hypothetical protein
MSVPRGGGIRWVRCRWANDPYARVTISYSRTISMLMNQA